MRGWTLTLLLALATLVTFSEAKLQSLCQEPGCECLDDADGLKEVQCQCVHNQVVRIGSEQNSHNSPFLPANTASLQLKGCHHVEIFARAFNHVVDSLKRVSVEDSTTAVLHQRQFEHRQNQNGGGGGGGANRHSLHLESFKISKVIDLKVHRHAFEGISVEDVFEISEVVMERVPSLAFNFDAVNEFRVQSSRFERVSTWGFKFGVDGYGQAQAGKCGQFNVFGQSTFFSLSTQAFLMTCDRVMLTYNTFNKLQDGSLAVTYGFADIQGNTFETFIGKPFKEFRPLQRREGDPHQSGLVFRENRISGDPTLPFNSLAMPGYADLLTAAGEGQSDDTDGTVIIESNHFRCQCDSVAWLIAAMEHDYQKDKIFSENDRGSWPFLEALYNTADGCVECSLQKCQLSPEGSQKFLQFARSALFSPSGKPDSLVCADSGKPVGDGTNGHTGSRGISTNLFTNGGGVGSGKNSSPINIEDGDGSKVPVAEETTGGSGTPRAAASVLLTTSFMLIIHTML